MKINIAIRFALSGLIMAAMLMSVSAFAADMHTSSQFQGPKANKGTVSHSNKDGKSVLPLADDFVVPDTPDPHWQVVDSSGNVYLLDKLKTKALIGDNYKKSITLRTAKRLQKIAAEDSSNPARKDTLTRCRVLAGTLRSRRGCDECGPVELGNTFRRSPGSGS